MRDPKLPPQSEKNFYDQTEQRKDEICDDLEKAIVERQQNIQKIQKLKKVINDLKDR